MAYPPPPTTPPVPQRGDRATFSSRVDAFLLWVAAIIPWMTGYVSDFMARLTTLAAGGANSFVYRFDTAIADADPGDGMLRFNSATQNTTTVIRIDSVTAGVSIASTLNALIGRTSSIKGSIRLQKFNDMTAWMLFDVTSGTNASGYFNINVILRALSSANPFSADDVLVVFLDPGGDKGDVGTFSSFPTIYAREEYTGSTNAPTIATGGVARDINTTVYNTIGASASLSTGDVILSSGTYEFEASAPIFSYNNFHRIGVMNSTDGVYVGFGPFEYITNGVAGNLHTFARVKGRMVVTGVKRFKVMHFTNAPTLGGAGINAAPFGGGNGIFTEVLFRKIA